MIFKQRYPSSHVYIYILDLYIWIIIQCGVQFRSGLAIPEIIVMLSNEILYQSLRHVENGLNIVENRYIYAHVGFIIDN